MATLNIDDKLQDQGGASTQSLVSNPQLTSSGPSGDVGSSGQAPVSTAGVGAGGGGGWTNIQAYLNANQGSNYTAPKVKDEIGQTFDKEESKINSQSESVKNQAQSAGKKMSLADIDNAIQGREGAGDVKGYLNSQYSGPTQFSYGLGADTQSYGSSLEDPGKFQGYLNQFYNKASGGRFNPGQAALQNQLDINDPNVEKTRQDLASRYNALTNLAGLKTQEADQAAKNAQNSFSQGQSEAKSYLSDRAKSLKDQISSLAPSAKYGDPRIPLVNQYNQIQDFLGLGGTTLDQFTPPASGPGDVAQPEQFMNGLSPALAAELSRLASHGEWWGA